MAVRWKLKGYLDQHGITAYRLAQETHGELSQTGVYRLLSDELGGVRFESLNAVLKALRTLTGHEVTPNDLLEYQEG